MGQTGERIRRCGRPRPGRGGLPPGRGLPRSACRCVGEPGAHAFDFPPRWDGVAGPSFELRRFCYSLHIFKGATMDAATMCPAPFKRHGHNRRCDALPSTVQTVLPSTIQTGHSSRRAIANLQRVEAARAVCTSPGDPSSAPTYDRICKI